MADIKKIKIEDNYYDVNDATAREILRQLLPGEPVDNSDHQSIADRIDEKTLQHLDVTYSSENNGHVPKTENIGDNSYLRSNGEWQQIAGDTLDDNNGDTPVSGKAVGSYVRETLQGGTLETSVQTIPISERQDNTAASNKAVSDYVTEELKEAFMLKGSISDTGFNIGQIKNTAKKGDSYISTSDVPLHIYDNIVSNALVSSTSNPGQYYGMMSRGDLLICTSAQPNTVWAILQSNITVGTKQGNVPEIANDWNPSVNKIVLSSSDGKLKLSDNAIGNAAYKNTGAASGNIPLVDNLNSINGTRAGGTFYAPTSAGSANQVLVSNGSGPYWNSNIDVNYVTTNGFKLNGWVISIN